MVASPPISAQCPRCRFPSRFVSTDGGTSGYCRRCEWPYSIALNAAPAGLAVAAVVGGGTFAAATYFWKITFVNFSGETTGSNEATVAIVLNGRANLTWTAPPASTMAVNVYRGTVTNTENVLVATLPGTSAAYTDTGLAGTAATPPAAMPVSTLNGATGIGAAAATLANAAGFVPQQTAQFDTAGNAENQELLINGNVVTFPFGRTMKLAHGNGVAVAAFVLALATPGVQAIQPVSPYLSGG